MHPINHEFVFGRLEIWQLGYWPKLSFSTQHLFKCFMWWTGGTSHTVYFWNAFSRVKCFVTITSSFHVSNVWIVYWVVAQGQTMLFDQLISHAHASNYLSLECQYCFWTQPLIYLSYFRLEACEHSKFRC